jgi:hypothetical protein
VIRTTSILPLLRDHDDRMVTRDDRFVDALCRDSGEHLREWAQLGAARRAVASLLWSFDDDDERAPDVVAHLALLADLIRAAWDGAKDAETLADVLRCSSLFGAAPSWELRR